jgi:hypothetical protein
VALPGVFCFVFVHYVSAILFLFVVFCSVSGFPSVLVTVFRHRWGRVVSPSSQFCLHACVCVVHVSPYDVVILPFVWYCCGQDFLCLNIHVFHIVLHYWVIRGIHQHVIWILVALLCSVIVPWVMFSSAMLGCSCVHRNCDVCSMTGVMFTVVCVPSRQVSGRVSVVCCSIAGRVFLVFCMTK